MNAPIFESTIPGRPVSQKNRKIIAKGRLITAQCVRDWKRAAAAKLQFEWMRPPITEPVRIDFVFHYAKGPYADLDNLLAAPLDVLQSVGILKNDSQVYEIHAHRFKHQKENQTTVRIYR